MSLNKMNSGRLGDGEDLPNTLRRGFAGAAMVDGQVPSTKCRSEICRQQNNGVTFYLEQVENTVLNQAVNFLGDCHLNYGSHDPAFYDLDGIYWQLYRDHVELYLAVLFSYATKMGNIGMVYHIVECIYNMSGTDLWKCR